MNAQATALRSLTSALGVAAWTAGLTVLAYLAWLAWDQPLGPMDLDSPPLYENWQLYGLAGTLALLAAAATWFGDGRSPVVVIPTILGMAYVIDAWADGPLWWPIDALSIAASSLLIALAVSVNVWILKRNGR